MFCRQRERLMASARSLAANGVKAGRAGCSSNIVPPGAISFTLYSFHVGKIKTEMSGVRDREDVEGLRGCGLRWPAMSRQDAGATRGGQGFWRAIALARRWAGRMPALRKGLSSLSVSYCAGRRWAGRMPALRKGLSSLSVSYCAGAAMSRQDAGATRGVRAFGGLLRWPAMGRQDAGATRGRLPGL